MSRYQKGSVNNNWNRDQDGSESSTRQPSAPDFYVICWSSDGACLHAISYRPHEEELARLAFSMNRAALTENPRLLPERTTEVVLKRGDQIIDHARIDDAVAA